MGGRKWSSGWVKGGGREEVEQWVGEGWKKGRG